MTQVSGSFSVELELDRLADRIAERVADRLTRGDHTYVREPEPDAAQRGHIRHGDVTEQGLIRDAGKASPGVLIAVMVAVVVAVFAYGFGRAAGSDSVDLLDQQAFPCQEDELLGYSPEFGPDRVGCLHWEQIAEDERRRAYAAALAALHDQPALDLDRAASSARNACYLVDRYGINPITLDGWDRYWQQDWEKQWLRLSVNVYCPDGRSLAE